VPEERFRALFEEHLGEHRKTVFSLIDREEFYEKYFG